MRKGRAAAKIVVNKRWGLRTGSIPKRPQYSAFSPEGQDNRSRS